MNHLKKYRAPSIDYTFIGLQMSECISVKISFSHVVNGLSGFTYFTFCASFTVYFACRGANFMPSTISLFFIFFQSLTFKYPYLWYHLIKSLSRFSLVRIARPYLSFTLYKFTFCHGKSNRSNGPINRRMMFPKCYSISFICNFSYG